MDTTGSFFAPRFESFTSMKPRHEVRNNRRGYQLCSCHLSNAFYFSLISCLIPDTGIHGGIYQNVHRVIDLVLVLSLFFFKVGDNKWWGDQRQCHKVPPYVSQDNMLGDKPLHRFRFNVPHEIYDAKCQCLHSLARRSFSRLLISVRLSPAVVTKADYAQENTCWGLSVTRRGTDQK